MNKFIQTLTNTRGDVLPGDRLQVVTSAGAAVDIYADDSSTPFTDSDGNVVNYATADLNGLVEFYWTPASGQVLQQLDTTGTLRRAITDFAKPYLLSEFGGEVAQAQVTGLVDDLAAKAATADLASTDTGKGDDMVATLAPGTDAAPRTVRDVLRSLPILVDDYRRTSDSDDTAAFQRAIAYAQTVDGGDVVASDRAYSISSHIPLEGSYDRSPRLVLGPRTVITQTGAGEPVVKIGDTGYYRGGGIIGGGKLVAAAGAGHTVEFGQYGASVSRFDVDVYQENADKSCWYGRFPNGGPSDAGIYACRFEGGDWVLPASLTSTVHGFDIIAYGTRFNENTISPQRCYNAAAEQFFRISNTQANTWHTNNKFAGINFQICPGGGILCDSAKGWLLEMLGFWDAGTAYVNHLIHFASGTGLESIANTLVHVGRNGDSLGSGIHDIFAEAAEDTFVANCYTESGAVPSYDWNNNRVVVVGVMTGESNVSQRLRLAGNQLIHAASILGSVLYGDTEIHLGGINEADQWKVFSDAGYIQHEPVANSLGLLLGVKDSGGALHKLVFENNGSALFPLEDNLTSLGASGQRWKSGFFALTDAADDAAAATAGVVVGQLYRTGSAVKIRVA